MSNNLERYSKLKISLKYQLLGKGYLKALEAFNFAKQYHSGTRKDGTTPEFQHQIEICLYILTLRGVQNEEDVLCAALLHDVREDYEIEHQVLVERFGAVVADAVECLTKKFKGDNKSYNNYFKQLSLNPIASIVKGADRINNVNSMIGVFTSEKQLEYVKLVEEYFLPMLKRARENFPEQTYAYLNIESVLKSLVVFVKALNQPQDK